MPHQTIVVRAIWDTDALVWVAASEDVPGLVVEADTFEALRGTVPVRVGELIELNGTSSTLPDIPVHILAEHTSRVADPATVPQWRTTRRMSVAS
jgi:hypothetical protein